MDENALRFGVAIFTSKKRSRSDVCVKRSRFFSAVVHLFNIGGVVQRGGGGGGGDGKDRQEGDDGRRRADGGGSGSGGCGSRHSRLRWRTEAAPQIGQGIY